MSDVNSYSARTASRLIRRLVQSGHKARFENGLLVLDERPMQVRLHDGFAEVSLLGRTHRLSTGRWRGNWDHQEIWSLIRFYDQHAALLISTRWARELESLVGGWDKKASGKPSRLPTFSFAFSQDMKGNGKTRIQVRIGGLAQDLMPAAVEALAKFMRADRPSLDAKADSILFAADLSEPEARALVGWVAESNP